MRGILLYLVYGNNPSYVREARFSILSALQYLKNDTNIEIVIYCENKELFSDLPVTIIIIDQNQFNNWKGPDNYIHRTKNRIHKEVILKYDCPVAFVDTDTSFKASPIKIFELIEPGQSVLHTKEKAFFDCGDMASRLSGINYTRFKGSNFRFDQSSTMWNSGIIGLHPNDKQCLDEALHFIDQWFARSGRIFVIEQLAISEALRLSTTIIPGLCCLEHYYSQKNFVDAKLKLFFSSHTISELLNKPELTSAIKLGKPMPPWYAKIRVNSLMALHRAPTVAKKIARALSFANYRYENPYDEAAKLVWVDYAKERLDSVEASQAQELIEALPPLVTRSFSTEGHRLLNQYKKSVL